MNIDARKARSLERKFSHFDIGQPSSNRNRVESPVLADQHLQGIDVFSVDQPKARKALERLIRVRNLLRCQFELIARLILSQYRTVAIVDQAANRRQGLYANPVAL